MKIVLEDKDIRYINLLKNELGQEDSHALFINDLGSFSFSFDVVDIPKANAFICGIALTKDRKKVKEIEETIGIRFTSLNFEENIKINKVKELLNRALKEIEGV